MHCYPEARPVWATNHDSVISQPCASFGLLSAYIDLPFSCDCAILDMCCRRLMETNPWHNDRPQWSLGSAFQEQQEGLTMKLLRLLPFCAEALKSRHSASFSSSCPRWGFYRELLKTLGTYRAPSLMACWLTDWCVRLSRCCKSCSGVILTRIHKHIKHGTLLCSFFSVIILMHSVAYTVPSE